MTIKMKRVLWAVLPVAATTMAQTVCISSNNVFHVKVDLFASELGTSSLFITSSSRRITGID
jgi:hypothetical protein